MPRTIAKKGQTIVESAYPSSDLLAVAKKWVAASSTVMLDAIWNACAQFRAEVLDVVDLDAAPDDLERSVTQLLEPRIRRALTGDEPFYPQHGVHEWETRQPPPAQPPLYDIAFILTANPRIMWPIEAKVLKTDKAVAPYVRDLREEFLTCRYAPFSPEGVMLGYLVTGDATVAFKKIAEDVPCKIAVVAVPAPRQQAVSEHRRTVPAGKQYAVAFRCHHLIMPLVKL
jgi:hypothetical protein